MNRKDIALTTAGVLATMALAYLFYRQQAAAAAAAAPAVQDVTDPNYYTNQGLYDASMAYQYASQLPSLSVPTVSSTSSTSALSSQVDTSASTAATGYEPGTDMAGLLSQIIADYHDSYGPSSGTADFSSLQIPTLDAPPSITTTGIPVTAQQAQQDLMQQTITVPTEPGQQYCPGGSGGGGTCGNIPGITINGTLDQNINPAVPPPSQQAPATSSSGPIPVHNNHILASASPGYYAA